MLSEVYYIARVLHVYTHIFLVVLLNSLLLLLLLFYCCEYAPFIYIYNFNEISLYYVMASFSYDVVIVVKNHKNTYEYPYHFLNYFFLQIPGQTDKLRFKKFCSNFFEFNRKITFLSMIRKGEGAPYSFLTKKYVLVINKAFTRVFFLTF